MQQRVAFLEIEICVRARGDLEVRYLAPHRHVAELRVAFEFAFKVIGEPFDADDAFALAACGRLRLHGEGETSGDGVGSASISAVGTRVSSGIGVGGGAVAGSSWVGVALTGGAVFAGTASATGSATTGGASKTGKTGKDHPVVAALPPQAAEE